MRAPGLQDVWEIRFAAAGACQAAATFVVCAVGLPTADAFGILLVLTAVLGLVVRPLPAAGLGLVGWALFTGFVTNSYGELTFSHADLSRLAVAVLAPVVLSYAARGRVRR